MNLSSLPSRLLSIALLAALLAGCAAPQASAAETAPTAPAAAADRSPVAAAPATQPPRPAPVGTATPSPNPGAGPAASPTPDLRLPPEQWQDWPVAPAVTSRAVEIYALGQTLGNDPRRFSKIGDCQSIKEALMGMFDRPGFYRLTPSQQYLEEAIAHFAGSFNRDGNAVQGGFNAASVLSPMWANPATCQAGENPLECEYRVHQPAFAIISLEVWWNGRTPERYEQYMRRIIEYAASHGVVPILSTKADNVEGNHSINLATARLAYEYNLPLWNWWRAAQDLPNKGLDPTRPDGFHLSEEAWLPRSVTALQALDSVWRGVSATSATAASGPLPSPTAGPEANLPAPQPPQISQPTPLATFAAGKISGRVLISLAGRRDETLQPLGVLRVDLQTGAREQILGEGAALQAQATDGRLLFSRGSDLYHTQADGSGAVKIAANLAQAGGPAALWVAGGAAYLADLNGQTALVYDRLDGSGWTRLTGADHSPQALIAAPDAERVYWSAAEGVFATTLAGVTTPLEGITRPFFSPRAPKLAFVRVKSEDSSLLVLGSSEGGSQREAPLPGDLVLDAAWSPDGEQLSVLLLNRSEYSGRMGSVNHFVFTPANFGTRELPRASGLNPRSAWSPGGEQLLVAGTLAVDSGYQVYARVIDARSLAVVEITAPLAAQSPELILVTALAWESR